MMLFYVLALVVQGEAAFVSQRDVFRWRRKLATTVATLANWSSCLSQCRDMRRYASSDSSDDLDWLSAPQPDLSEMKLAKPSSSSQDEQPADDLGNIQIPSTGISVTDEMEVAQQEKFESDVVPITDLPGVAQIVTIASSGGIEPVRYLVSLSPPKRLAPAATDSKDSDEEKPMNDSVPVKKNAFVMVDIPPFSEKLLAQMRKFMGPGSTFAAMLITSRDVIHYDEAPAVFTTRKSDLKKWAAAFPGVEIVGYRLDIPRDCRDMITQQLDGYGPWALEEASGQVTFAETGRPLTYEEWDEEVAKRVLGEGTAPPDDALENLDDDMYTPEAIRKREEGKRLLAVYTPGHTFGSISFIFPEIRACCSGYTIPVEDDRYDETMGIGGGGPALDFRGYVTTSRAGMNRMMESARHVVNTYSDRFTVVLPSRGDPLFVDDGSSEDRQEALNGIIDEYDKIGKIYERLGIT